MKPQSKLWVIQLLLMQDNSTCKLQSQMTFRLCTSFLKLGFHYSPPLAG
jgi:hypothetical protein